MKRMRPFGIYIHIPFCTYQCPFCAFSTVQYSRPLVDEYIVAIKREIHHHLNRVVFPGQKLQSLYLGGGTPSLIPTALLSEILDLCRSLFKTEKDLEVTLEATPESVHPEKVRTWLKAGINRLSIGAQSFSDPELRLLGRKHTARQIHQVVRIARAAGCANLSLDLIYGLPGQTLDQWLSNLKAALDLSPEHLSCYGLTLEEGTLFAQSAENGRFTLPDEVLQSEMYLAAHTLLAEQGFSHYETSNFARPGYPCRHNLIYWSDGEYLGLGASAHSHLDGSRLMNCFSPQEYIRRVLSSGSATVETERLFPEEKAREAIVFGLRRAEGLHLSKILHRYQVKLPTTFYIVLHELQSQGLLSLSSGKLKLTIKGLLLADELAATLLSA